MYGERYMVSYGHDVVVGWFLDVFEDEHFDPMISYAQFESYDPYENYEALYSTPIAMKATGFNGKLLAYLLMFFRIPNYYYFHIGQMKTNSEPIIRTEGCLTSKRDINPNPIQIPADDKGWVFVYTVNPNF